MHEYLVKENEPCTIAWIDCTNWFPSAIRMICTWSSWLSPGWMVVSWGSCICNGCLLLVTILVLSAPRLATVSVVSLLLWLFWVLVVTVKTSWGPPMLQTACASIETPSVFVSTWLLPLVDTSMWWWLMLSDDVGTELEGSVGVALWMTNWRWGSSVRPPAWFKLYVTGCTRLNTDGVCSIAPLLDVAWCWSCMCSCNASFPKKSLWQMAHWKCFFTSSSLSPSVVSTCVKTCLRKEDWSSNDCSQWSHLKSRSVVWNNRCRFKLSWSSNVFPHWGHFNMLSGLLHHTTCLSYKLCRENDAEQLSHLKALSARCKSMWFLRVERCRKSLLQISQRYNFSAVCMYMCCRRCSLRVNFLSQRVQAKRLAPVCVIMCLRKVDLSLKARSQCSHLKGFFSRWMNMWRLRVERSAKHFKHVSHWKLLSGWWILRCVFKACAELKFLPHKSHWHLWRVMYLIPLLSTSSNVICWCSPTPPPSSVLTSVEGVVSEVSVVSVVVDPTMVGERGNWLK